MNQCLKLRNPYSRIRHLGFSPWAREIFEGDVLAQHAVRQLGPRDIVFAWLNFLQQARAPKLN